MPATKTQLLGGSFQDSLGNPLENGTLKFHLSQDCLVSGVGTVCSGIDVIIQLDSTGNVASSASTPSAPNQYIWSNLVMTPQNNYYRVTGYTAQGQIAFGGNNQQVGSGATFNLDNWTPNTVLSWFPSIQNLSLEVNGSQASSQVLQNLVEGAGITITDEGGGVISFASSVTLNVEVGGTPLSSTNPINFEAGAGIAVTNPSAGNVLITNTAPFVSGGFPGQWLGQTAAVAPGGTIAGYGIGLDMAWTNGTGIPHFATATQGQYSSVQTTSAVNSFGLSDQYAGSGGGLGITLGILGQWFTKMVTAGLTFSRYWIGICDQGVNTFPTVMNSDTPACNFVGFRFSSDVDTNYMAVCQTDGTHQTLVDTGVVASATAVHIFKIIPTVSGTQVTFYIDGVLVATISTNVPSTSVAMGNLICGDDINNVGGSNLQINWYYTWLNLIY